MNIKKSIGGKLLLAAAICIMGSNLFGAEPESFCPENYRTKKAGVEYGKTEHLTYYSKVCERERPVNITLPANYSADKKYPVMFFLHGYWENENSWVDRDVVVQNLMADKKAEEMIIVHPFIYCSKTKNQCTSFQAKEDWDAYDNIVNEICQALLPWLKTKYSIKEGRENTAVIGFSMGGRESLACGLLRPEVFGWVGAIAPAPGLFPNSMGQPGQMKANDGFFPTAYTPKLLMICVGDKDGVVTPFPETYHNHFVSNKTDHIWYKVPGSDHGDPAVSSGIYNFAIRIFK